MQWFWKLAQIAAIAGMTYGVHEAHPADPIGGHLFAAIVTVYAGTALISNGWYWLVRMASRIGRRAPQIRELDRNQLSPGAGRREIRQLGE